MKQIKYVYNLTRTLMRPLVDRYFDRSVMGSENVPNKGPCIVAFNHPRGYDPLMVGVSVNRNFHFVATESIYTNIPRKIYYNLMGCIKMGARSSKPIKKIYELLKDRKAVFVFPRGSPEESSKKSKPTLAKIVLAILEKDNLEIPIITGNIRYSEENEKPRVRITFNKPIEPRYYLEEYRSDKKKGIKSLTDSIDDMIDLL